MLFNKIRIRVLHTMLGQFFRVRCSQITRGNDRVRINIIAEFPNFSFKYHIKILNETPIAKAKRIIDEQGDRLFPDG